MATTASIKVSKPKIKVLSDSSAGAFAAAPPAAGAAPAEAAEEKTSLILH